MSQAKRLSNRVRPGSEAAPWVVEEIARLERTVERLRKKSKKHKDRGNRLAAEVRASRSFIDDVSNYGNGCGCCATEDVADCERDDEALKGARAAVDASGDLLDARTP